MKIGIIKETKNPVDNRVALTPQEILELQKRYTNAKFYVQSSGLRAYHDDEYREAGIPIVDSASNCDFLLGLKEADIDSLIPNKHYFFLGHIAKNNLTSGH